MYVGVARLVLQIPGARSVKERRGVVRSYKERVKVRLAISVAEVGDSQKLQVATLGLSVVSGESSVCQELLEKARSMANSLPEAILADWRTQVLSFGAAGAAIEAAWSRRKRVDRSAPLPDALEPTPPTNRSMKEQNDE